MTKVYLVNWVTFGDWDCILDCGMSALGDVPYDFAQPSGVVIASLADLPKVKAMVVEGLLEDFDEATYPEERLSVLNAKWLEDETIPGYWLLANDEADPDSIHAWLIVAE